MQQKRLKEIILDYSFHNGWDKFYSVKIYKNGIAFLRDSDDSLDYFISDIDTKEIEETLNPVLKEKKREYINTSIKDSESFVLLAYKRDKILKFYVNSYDYPNSLKVLNNYLIKIKDIKERKKLQDTSVQFESLKYIKPNPKIDHSLRFDSPRD
jgi:hypothetical protein